MRLLAVSLHVFPSPPPCTNSLQAEVICPAISQRKFRPQHTDAMIGGGGSGYGGERRTYSAAGGGFGSSDRGAGYGMYHFMM